MNIQLQNILFYPSWGGIESYLYYTAKTLLSLGHTPSILCTRQDQSLAKQMDYEGINVLRHLRPNLPFPLTFFNPTYYVSQINKYLREIKSVPDRIISRHSYYCYASLKAFGEKVPITYIPANAFAEYLSRDYATAGFIKKTYIKAVIPQAYHIEKSVLKICQDIVVLSHSQKKAISDYYRVPNEKFRVIPPGIDMDRFQPNLMNRRVIREEWGIKERDTVVLTASRLTPEKNVLMLIDAFAALKKKDIFLIIAGDGWQKPVLEAKVRELGFCDQVRFIGMRKDMPQVYQGADIFVLCSRYEGFGHVYLEAMASGLPCIGLRSDPPRIVVATEEIIENEKSGFCVDPDKNDELVEKLSYLTENISQRKAMGLYARSICQRNFNWNSNTKKILNI